MAAISLIIPTLDRAQMLRTLLDSLKDQSLDDFETVVVDQSAAPNMEVSEHADASGGSLRYIHIERKSLPNARNVGADAASGAILVFIDDDVELSPDFLQAHCKRMEDPAIAAVAGRITGGYDDGPADAKVIGAVSPWTGTVTRNFHLTFPVDSIDQLPGGNFSVRREVYAELGGFDANTFGGPASIGEETDFSQRLRRSGRQIAFEPRAHLIHLHAPRGGCRDDSVVRWTYWHGHNMAALRRRYSPWYLWPLYLWLSGARYLIHGLKRGNPMVWVAGCWGTVAGLVCRR